MVESIDLGSTERSSLGSLEFLGTMPGFVRPVRSARMITVGKRMETVVQRIGYVAIRGIVVPRMVCAHVTRRSDKETAKENHLGPITIRPLATMIALPADDLLCKY